MPRTPSIRYYDSRKAYYTKFQGKQHLLAAGPKDEPDGRTYKDAVLRFSQIMHASEVDRSNDNCVVSAIISRYYFSLKREERGRSLHLARSLLDSAIAEFGHVKVKELKPFVVRDWVEKMTTWCGSTKHTAIGKLTRVFYWAKKEGMITTNPIAEMEKPEKRSRGKEVIIPAKLQDVLIESANPEFAKVLLFLRHTGARPGEAANARASHYRKDIGALVYPWQGDDAGYRWKNAKKTKRDRVIYLTPELQAMIEGEAAKRPDGYIFMTIRKHVWNNNNLVNRMDKLVEHKAVKKWCRVNKFSPEHLMLYGFRHSYASDMLMKGVPIKVLADWMGTSVGMLEKTYSHIHDDLKAMRTLFLQFTGGASEPPRP
jgi:integrase